MQLIKTFRKYGTTLRVSFIDNNNSYGKSRLAYELKDGQNVIFTGKDFFNSPMHADDSLQTVRFILGFLTLQPGDTDAEYFANYTDAQFAFINSDKCENLRLYLSGFDN